MSELFEASYGVRSATQQLLTVAAGEYPYSQTGDDLRWVLLGLREPLRVAIAGRVKAGKSTLLNALVGECVAPTDEGECTQLVTWYRNGPGMVTARMTGQTEARQLPFRRDGAGALDVDLQGLTLDEVDHLVVDWPSTTLKALQLVDTPGLGSLRSQHGERTSHFVVTGRADLDTVDAVIYLMQHLHDTDARFLEAFHDDDLAHPSPVNTIAVLSRADEIGCGQLDSMETAARIAARYRTDPQIRRLAQTVCPVSGLLAETAATLRQEDFSLLALLAGHPADLRHIYVSVDRLLDAPLDGITRGARRRLLEKLGMFGVKFAVTSIATGATPTAPSLAAALRAISGIDALHQELLLRFGSRAGVLKSRWALARAEAVLRREQPAFVRDKLLREIERIRTAAHEFAEIRLLDQLRSTDVGFHPDELEEAERLAGYEGPELAARLGLPAGALPEHCRAAVLDALNRWQRRSEHPRTTRQGVIAARTLIETCEALHQTISLDDGA